MTRTTHSAPRRYSFLFGLGLLVAGAVVLLVLVLAMRDAVDPLRRAEAWSAYERQQRLNEELSTLDMLIAAGWRLLPLVLVAGAGGVSLLALYHRLAARRFVEADKLIALQRAQRQQFPDSLQTLAFHDSSRQAPPMLQEPAYGEEEGENTPAPPPTFAALLDSGRIGRGNPLLLGIGADGRPVDGSWLDLFSVGIGGLSGSGKSWTGAMLLSQAMLHGARVALLDPHAGDREALSMRLAPLASTGRYLCDVASDGRAMLATVKLLNDELERRKAGKGSREPWIVAADEFSALMRGEVAEPLALLFEAIAQEGRKLGIYGLALGQSWTASRSGGTELRDSLASCYLHRLRPAQARYLSGLTADDLPDDLLELPSGTAYLLSTRGELQRLTIPKMTGADVSRVAILVASTGTETTPARSLPAPSGKPVGSQVEASSGVASTAAQRAPAVSAEAQRAAGLFLDGNDLAAVVLAVRGVKSTEGRRYQQASAEVQALIREGMGALRGEP